MAILTPQGSNLQFTEPDIYKPLGALSDGLTALGGALDKRKLNKERDAFNAAIAGGGEAEIEAEMAAIDAQIAELEAKLGGG